VRPHAPSCPGLPRGWGCPDDATSCAAEPQLWLSLSACGAEMDGPWLGSLAK
jgi:hypothetical protein